MNSLPNANPLFPVFLKLEQLRVLLVGGGSVGLEKLSALLRNSPDTAITVVSLTYLPALRQLAAAGRGALLALARCLPTGNGQGAGTE